MSDLGREARDFAKHYVALVDALMKEGVAEQTAREEARVTALMLLYSPGPDDPACPLCGRAGP